MASAEELGSVVVLLVGTNARGIRSIVGIDGLVATLGGRSGTGGSAPEGHEADNKPATHFAHEHLRSLQHRLVEEDTLSWIAVGVAVANALIILV